MSHRALIVYGGWDGHTPEASARLFGGELEKHDYTVELADSLEVYTDADRMAGADLVVPIWTMGLADAVAAGTGLAGFHGGMCDAFRMNTGYQFMTGGQWVAHPGDLYPRYDVRLTDRDHVITRGLGDFELTNTERYYLHVDPSNRVLAEITFEESGVVMPYMWTRTWGEGRVFYAAWGHTHADFDGETARELVVRGMRWATRGGGFD